MAKNYSSAFANVRANKRKRKRKHFKDHSDNARRDRESADERHERKQKEVPSIKSKRERAKPYLRIYFNYKSAAYDLYLKENSVMVQGGASPEDTEFGAKLANSLVAAKTLQQRMGRVSVKITAWAWIDPNQPIVINRIEA